MRRPLLFDQGEYLPGIIRLLQDIVVVDVDGVTGMVGARSSRPCFPRPVFFQQFLGLFQRQFPEFRPLRPAAEDAAAPAAAGKIHLQPFFKNARAARKSRLTANCSEVFRAVDPVKAGHGDQPGLLPQDPLVAEERGGVSLVQRLQDPGQSEFGFAAHPQVDLRQVIAAARGASEGKGPPAAMTPS